MKVLKRTVLTAVILILAGFPLFAMQTSLTNTAAPANITAYGVATFTIDYMNTGAYPVNNYALWDTIPYGMTYMGASSGAVNTAGVVSWQLGTLNPGAAGTVYFLCQNMVGCIGGVSQVNRANDSAGSTGTAQFYVPSCTATCTITYTTTPAASATVVALYKSANRTYVNDDDTVTYTIAYGNNTTSTFNNYRVFDTLPYQTAFLAAQPAATVVKTGSVYNVSWNIGTLAPGASGTIIMAVSITNTSWPVYSVCNQASDSAGRFSNYGCFINHTATATLTAVTSPTQGFTWSATPTATRTTDVYAYHTATSTVTVTRTSTPTFTCTVTPSRTFTCTVTVRTSPTITPTNGCAALNTSFGIMGVVTSAGSGSFTSNSNVLGFGMARDASGRLIVAGTVLWRYNPDGSRDTTFGAGGYIQYPGGGTGMAVVIDGNGKVVVCGRQPTTSGDDMCVWRFNADGSPDTTFNQPMGYFTHDAAAGVPGSIDAGNDVAIDASGRIVVAGFSQKGTYGDTDMAVWRLSGNGTLDTTFNGAGFVVHNNAAGGNAGDQAKCLVLDASGRIVAGGMSNCSSQIGEYDPVMWRVTSSGTLDTSFGGTGYVVMPSASNHGTDGILDIAMDQAGRIVAVGSVTDYNSFTNAKMAVWRYNDNGSPDNSFGAAGRADNFRDSTMISNSGSSMAIDTAGKIYVTGIITSPAVDMDMGIWRINPDGSLDTSYNGTGYFRHNNAAGGNYTDHGEKIIVQGNSVWVAGYSSRAVSYYYDMALWMITDACGSTPAATTTGTLTPARTRTYTQTCTMTATPSRTATPAITATVTQGLTFIPTATMTHTYGITAGATPTPTPTYGCNGIATPGYTVYAIYNPGKSDSITIEVVSTAPLAAPVNITVKPNSNHPAVVLQGVLVSGTSWTYRASYQRNNGYGDIDTITVDAYDLCGVRGTGNGSYKKVVVTPNKLAVFKNVFNPDKGERFRVVVSYPAPGKARVAVFNKKGILIKEFFKGTINCTCQVEYIWEGLNSSGSKVTSGDYIFSVQADTFTEKAKVAVVR